MRSVVAYPGNMEHAQQIARALHDEGWLTDFVTTFVWRPDGAAAALLARLPERLATRARRELSRRAMTQAPAHLVRAHPKWEVARSIALKARGGPRLVDAVWDRMIHHFDATVAGAYVAGADTVHAFEYSARETFVRAGAEGVVRVLHLASLASRSFEEILAREKAMWKELESPHDSYFARKFPRRQARRDEEIARADIIVANSRLTARSHIAAGADAAKVMVAQLGAPPPIAAPHPRDGDGPLVAVWAGSFSLGKGAHYMLEAWRNLNAGRAARLDVYGNVTLPQRARALATDTVAFRGWTPRAALFEAFRRADVLVFPSLSDGYGMVVAEAMAQGLPAIVSDMAGAADLVDADNGLIVPAADPGALTDALRWCLDNRDRLRAMRHGALAAARRRQWSDFRGDLMTGLRARLADRALTI